MLLVYIYIYTLLIKIAQNYLLFDNNINMHFMKDL